jgi:hypothetical protein
MDLITCMDRMVPFDRMNPIDPSRFATLRALNRRRVSDS